MGFGMGMCCCGCLACKDGVMPNTLTPTFAGFSTPNCAGWHDLNGSFVLDYVGCTIGGGGFGDHTIAATWRTFVDEPWTAVEGGFGLPCTQVAVIVDISWNPPTGERVITVTFNYACDRGFGVAYGPAIFTLTESDQTEPFDCQSFSSLSIPQTSDYCGDTITCTLSA